MTHPPIATPSWPHCDVSAPALASTICRGAQLPGNSKCLAHATPADRAAYLAALSPGDGVDHRGTRFTASLLDGLLDALASSSTGSSSVGEANFDECIFTEDANFASAIFAENSSFKNALFSGRARFDDVKFAVTEFQEATFESDASFDRAEFGFAQFERATFLRESFFSHAVFANGGWFEDVQFIGGVWFYCATFTGSAVFDGSIFGADWTGGSTFRNAIFSGGVGFSGTRFELDALFAGARFESAVLLGPISAGGKIVLSHAVFTSPATIEASANSLQCVRTQWESTATLRLRYADVDMSDAVLSMPMAISGHATNFNLGSGYYAYFSESGLIGDGSISIRSLRGVDAAHLVLTDTDLSSCIVTGAFHLDQLRLEGRAVFAQPPDGWRLRRGFPFRLARRRVLAEEHYWRAGATRAQNGWTPNPARAAIVTAGPNDLAPAYRELRKASEDAKNEPDAADFYYGEMEMRRNDGARPLGERVLISAYWLASGYGLRTTRALGWLLVTMISTVLAIAMWGLPNSESTTRIAGVQAPSDGRIALVAENPPLVLSGPATQRFTGERIEKSMRIVVKSVVFRSSGQDLTVAGVYIEMGCRFVEPVLLALAILAIRGRIKR